MHYSNVEESIEYFELRLSIAVPSSSDNTPWWKRRAGVPKRMVICEWTIRIGVQVIHPPPNVRNRRAKRRAVRILGDAESLDRLSDALYPMSRQGHGAGPKQ